MKTEIKDLKLGNYVNVPVKEQSPFRIDAFEYLTYTDFKIAMICDVNLHPLTWYNKDVKPIILTEQWLLSFGFKQYETVVIKTHNYIKGDFKFNSAVLWLCEFKGVNLNRKIIYVHQLQNLYYEITGNELQFIGDSELPLI